MATFLTRVELHDANWQDYEVLHKAMEAQGFRRFIKSDAGTWYHLPTAEYEFVGAFTRTQVLEKAKAAAATTRRAHGIITTESNGQTWHGLKQVTQRASV